MAFQRIAAIIIAGVLCLASTILADVVVKPTVLSGQQSAVILLGAQSVDPAEYTQFAQLLSNSTSTALWVSVPNGKISDVASAANVVNQARTVLLASGMPSGTVIYLATHSATAFVAQDYIAKNPTLFAGFILLGSVLLRSNFGGLKTPTLTIAGELDGVMRLSRVSEAYYHQVLHASSDVIAPVVVIAGMSHRQYFNTGSTSSAFKGLDLRPEISNEEAQLASVMIIQSFIAGDSLDKEMKSTQEILSPMIAALEQEGYENFMPPCHRAKGAASCYEGCPWSTQAQVTMSGSSADIHVADGFHSLSEVIPHDWLPSISGACPQDTAACRLDIVTVTDTYYADSASSDRGERFVSADEIQVKLISRQNVLEHVGQAPDFKTVDTNTRCAEINQAAYEYALNTAPARTRARFERAGVPMTFAPESESSIFPLWILSRVQYNTVQGARGPELQVKGYGSKFATNFALKISSGIHFCKLMSPARAMEWVYTEGLRAGLSV
eukprot:Colp12_sorted_trinity150504_noHs@14197